MGRTPLQTAIYLDHHATTPCDPRVVEAMLPYFAREFGNAASRTHAFGWRAEQAVEQARGEVAALVGADPREIVFTSGATESNNLALLGVARAARPRRAHVVTSRIEHRAVLDPCRALEREGVRVTYLDVARDGRVDPAAVEAALEADTLLVSIMFANNEIGTLQPIEAIGRIARARGVLFHCDAAQAAGKVPVDVVRDSIDLLSLSAHKLYGPKGVGALYVRRRPRIEIEPILHGGGHERGLRSGTLPVPLCVGFGAACAIAASERAGEAERLTALRERLRAALVAGVESVHLNGHGELRLPGNLNVSFDGVEAEALLAALPELALSSGSACTSAKKEPSHVLRALGLAPERSLGSIRIGLGRGTTEAEVDFAAGRIAVEVARLREMSPAWEDARRARR
jgi:cysteine desulfurase